jgi:hypothetical protein
VERAVSYVIGRYLKEEHLRILANGHSFYPALNAGAGGLDYNIPGMIDTDLVLTSLRHKRSFVSSVESLPVRCGQLATIICVGSVLNYARPSIAIPELTRCLGSGGQMVLEFERQIGACSNADGPISVTYKGFPHPMWLHSEKHVLELLSGLGNAVVRIQRFNAILSLAALLPSSGLTRLLVAIDQAVARRYRRSARNIILTCKRPHVSA